MIFNLLVLFSSFYQEIELTGDWEMISVFEKDKAEWYVQQPDNSWDIERTIIVSFYSSNKRKGSMKIITLMNVIEAAYSFKGDKISFTDVYSSKAGEPPWGQFVFDSIKEIENYNIKGDTLMMNSEQIKLIFKRVQD